MSNKRHALVDAYLAIVPAAGTRLALDPVARPVLKASQTFTGPHIADIESKWRDSSGCWKKPSRTSSFRGSWLR